MFDGGRDGGRGVVRIWSCCSGESFAGREGGTMFDEGAGAGAGVIECAEYCTYGDDVSDCGSGCCGCARGREATVCGGTIGDAPRTEELIAAMFGFE